MQWTYKLTEHDSLTQTHETNCRDTVKWKMKSDDEQIKIITVNVHILTDCEITNQTHTVKEISELLNSVKVNLTLFSC